MILREKKWINLDQPLKESETERNRRLMPETARIVDEFRAAFGRVIVRYAYENDIEVGRKPE